MKSTSARSPRRVAVTLDTWLSITAVVTSFCALTITIYQAYLQRKQQYASVMPVLDVYLNNGDIDSDARYDFDYVLVNNGIGPAFIRKFEYWYKGKKRESFRDIVNEEIKIGGPSEAVSIEYSGLWEGRIIPQNQEIKLVSIDGNALPQRLYERSGTIRLKVWYESIYGERWLFDTGSDRPETRLIQLD